MGEGEGVSRFARIWGQISNAHNSKTVKDIITLSIWYAIPTKLTMLIDCSRFQSSRTTYKGDSGSIMVWIWTMDNGKGLEMMGFRTKGHLTKIQRHRHRYKPNSR